MTKKPRGKPVLMEREHMRRRGQKPYARVVKDEFHNCNFPGCPNIVSVRNGYSGPVVCVLHRND